MTDLQPGSANAVRAAVAHIERQLGGRAPEVAIVLGSGLGALTDRIAEPIRIGYGEIPGFHLPTVAGHRGELVVGRLGGKVVIGQSGRFHMYEGYSAAEAVLPVRVFAALGVRTLIVTNAAGGINRAFAAGTVMLISDHINLTGRNPLIGPVRSGESRFPDMTVAYDAELRSLAERVAARLGVAVAQGIYVGLLGPNYETPAEIRVLERLGGDAVGMSTVAEVIAARSLGIRCLGISSVTNPAAGVTAALLSHTDVMDMAGQTGDAIGRLIEGVIAAL